MKLIYSLLILISAQAFGSETHHDTHDQGGKSKVPVAMEKDSVDYLNGTSQRSRNRLFNAIQVTGNVDASDDDIIILPENGKMKMLPIGQILQVLNAIEDDLRNEKETMQKCTVKDLQKVYLDNRFNRSDSGWIKPSCVRKK